MQPNSIVGSVTGTGAALNVPLGFTPAYIILVNRTTGRRVTWFNGQGAGKGLVDGPSVTTALLTTTGPSAYAGDATNGAGFTIGTDAVNTNGNVIDYVAFRSGAGARGI